MFIRIKISESHEAKTQPQTLPAAKQSNQADGEIRSLDPFPGKNDQQLMHIQHVGTCNRANSYLSRTQDHPFSQPSTKNTAQQVKNYQKQKTQKTAGAR